MKAPSELRVSKDRKTLTVSFEDQDSLQLPVELLRVSSPSAEVQGHGPAQRVTVFGKENVKISALEPVGHYAVRIIFDDGHSTGLFTWSFLHELGIEKDKRWSEYLKELAEKGLKRTGN